MREEYKRLVREEYWEDFVEFLKTGVCSEGFASYMNVDEDCQRAVDMALRRKFKKLFRLLRIRKLKGFWYRICRKLGRGLML